MVHSEEEALGTRLTIDSLTCLMANETDPSKLLAISPGKLMRYLVPDESHVHPDQPYAEIEVRARGCLDDEGGLTQLLSRSTRQICNGKSSVVC